MMVVSHTSTKTGRHARGRKIAFVVAYLHNLVSVKPERHIRWDRTFRITFDFPRTSFVTLKHWRPRL
jgi:hypothetical protein